MKLPKEVNGPFKLSYIFQDVRNSPVDWFHFPIETLT